MTRPSAESCPSRLAGGRTDRCGLYSFPPRCSETWSTLNDPPCRHCGQRWSVSVEGCIGPHPAAKIPVPQSAFDALRETPPWLLPTGDNSAYESPAPATAPNAPKARSEETP